MLSWIVLLCCTRIYRYIFEWIIRIKSKTYAHTHTLNDWVWEGKHERHIFKNEWWVDTIKLVKWEQTRVEHTRIFLDSCETLDDDDDYSKTTYKWHTHTHMPYSVFASSFWFYYYYYHYDVFLLSLVLFLVSLLRSFCFPKFSFASPISLGIKVNSKNICVRTKR